MQAFEHSRSASRDVVQNICTCNDGASSSSVEDGLGCTMLVDVTVCGKIGPRTEGCDFHRWGGVTHATVPVAIFILGPIFPQTVTSTNIVHPRPSSTLELLAPSLYVRMF